jgi:hypothetical protein
VDKGEGDLTGDGELTKFVDKLRSMTYYLGIDFALMMTIVFGVEIHLISNTVPPDGEGTYEYASTLGMTLPSHCGNVVEPISVVHLHWRKSWNHDPESHDHFFLLKLLLRATAEERAKVESFKIGEKGKLVDGDTLPTRTKEVNSTSFNTKIQAAKLGTHTLRDFKPVNISNFNTSSKSTPVPTIAVTGSSEINYQKLSEDVLSELGYIKMGFELAIRSMTLMLHKGQHVKVLAEVEKLNASFPTSYGNTLICKLQLSKTTRESRRKLDSQQRKVIKSR